MEDFFAFSIQQILCQGIGVGIIIAIDKYVVRRRDSIVQTVRRLQATLRIPPCLAVVSDTAPGVTDQSLRYVTELAVFFGLSSLALFVVVVMIGKAKSLWGLVAGVVVPACVTIFIWTYLICTRRRFDRGERDTFDKEDGLRISIRSMLGTSM
ncbi:hypothetical protein FHL15_010898 [Xylaria flabelliformis]|uniref:Uncharacterized protein n=1 Tax=Xylaria flabelliformis TaxID=2512241 RepID=A0A553HJU1_9PEZI|nr:hypothetical protein FHL15_010898 [Xylaria flabelliformis]